MIFGLERMSGSAEAALLDDASTTWLSYAQLVQSVAAAAEQLRAMPRHIAFVFGANDVPTVVAYLACLEAAYPVALFRADLAPARQQALLDRYRPGLVFRQHPPAGYASAVMSTMPAAPLAAWQRLSPASSAHPSLALLLSTSGSTGSPRLVRLSQLAVTSNADSIRQALAITAPQRAALHLPISYSYGLSVLDSHLIAGASVLLTELGFLSREFWSRLASERVTSLPGVPYVYQSLRRLGFEQLAPASLDTLTQAGGCLAEPLVEHFHALMRARGGRFFVMYGQTEATARISVLPSEWLPEKVGSVGRAIPGGALDIKGSEIIYTGANVMLGYAECAADLARGDELGGRLATGDLGRLDDDGCLYVTGRSKRIAKVAGVRLNLDEVEALAASYAPAAALERDAQLVIVLEARDAEELCARARRELATALSLSPASIRVQAIERLPTGENHKLDRSAL